ncbi:unnamed protein product [Cyprideis torosa]|uniref:Uncharacterized protein n=1 Tax=Cyprideis torosa TaxID=163714 RepID=A0A7R8WH76_9CRUS|nr:unnamed protein product [Cyprideis torosa]CAG0893489.1 unnamed protein product [Cyprideis torosa]
MNKIYSRVSSRNQKRIPAKDDSVGKSSQDVESSRSDDDMGYSNNHEEQRALLSKTNRRKSAHLPRARGGGQSERGCRHNSIERTLGPVESKGQLKAKAIRGPGAKKLKLQKQKTASQESDEDGNMYSAKESPTTAAGEGGKNKDRVSISAGQDGDNARSAAQTRGTSEMSKPEDKRRGNSAGESVPSTAEADLTSDQKASGKERHHHHRSQKKRTLPVPSDVRRSATVSPQEASSSTPCAKKEKARHHEHSNAMFFGHHLTGEQVEVHGHDREHHVTLPPRTVHMPPPTMTPFQVNKPPEQTHGARKLRRQLSLSVINEVTEAESKPIRREESRNKSKSSKKKSKKEAPIIDFGFSCQESSKEEVDEVTDVDDRSEDDRNNLTEALMQRVQPIHDLVNMESSSSEIEDIGEAKQKTTIISARNSARTKHSISEEFRELATSLAAEAPPDKYDDRPGGHQGATTGRSSRSHDREVIKEPRPGGHQGATTGRSSRSHDREVIIKEPRPSSPKPLLQLKTGSSDLKSLPKKTASEFVRSTLENQNRTLQQLATVDGGGCGCG